MEKLTERMINHRANYGLSVEKAAKECGIATQTWRYLEKGLQSPSRVTQRKLEIYLDKKGESHESFDQSDQNV